ncbi:hypothetical protein LCGC14_1028950 [marine sediment metagenome]|uniref:Uncharacterized protein n=1 Tax=marine sediment metagenome TaxID=412755 RepID=A0A0F9QD87_9ZZZZ
MLYIFQSGDEFLKLKIDRKNKKFEIASSKTTYRFIPTPFWKLFGDAIKTLKGLKPPTEEESKKEMSEAELLSDEDFEKKVINDSAQLGYILVKKI